MSRSSISYMHYLPPLLWAASITMILFGAFDWWSARRRPYRQIRYISKSEGISGAGVKDSRGLSRAVRIMDKGAGFIRVKQSWWERLERRLSLMGEKTNAKEMVTLLLLRSLTASLPALVFPFVLEGWQYISAYPIAVAFFFRRELRELERRYSKWQNDLAKDIPAVMDRMRICFAGGRDYMSALQRAQASGGPAMRGALGQLIHDIHSIGSAGAFRLFAVSFDLPAIQKLASAMTIAVESGYGAAEAYFNSIEGELAALRQESAESLVRSKPEKIYQLYIILFGLAVAALILKAYEILNQVGRLFT